MKTIPSLRLLRQMPRCLWIVLLAPWLLLAPVSGAAAEEAVVHCVLFYSPTCPHCHQVINETIIPLTDEYGTQLELVAVNTAVPQGQALYQAAIQSFAIPDQRRGVPTLIVADVVLVGSGEIPQQLPGLVESYLKEGGVGWPAIPGLAEAISQAPAPTPIPTAVPAPPGPVVEAAPATLPAPAATAPAEPVAESEVTGVGDLASAAGDALSEGFFATAVDRFRQDVAGNTLSVIVLLGMIGAVFLGASRLRASRETPAGNNPRSQQLIPALLLIGLAVSVYMAYVEMTRALAVCGPVGDCNSVQQSEYARLFGVLPMGVLGAAGYTLLALLWALGRRGQGARGWWAHRLLALTAVGGTLFSIYLTFLEPFVIGATCMWCLTSAVVMTLVMLLSTAGGPVMAPPLPQTSSDSATGEPAL